MSLRKQGRTQLVCYLLMSITFATMTPTRAAPTHPSSEVVTAADLAAATAASAATAGDGPPANASASCTRSKHVVLASFGMPKEYQTVSLYFASKFPDTAVHHLLLHLGREKMQDEEEEETNASKERTSPAATAAATATAATATASAAATSSSSAQQRLRSMVKLLGETHPPVIIEESRRHNHHNQNHHHSAPTPTTIDWRAFYHAHGIHRSVIDMSSLEEYHKLRESYVHSSVNGYEYELLCFARFIGLRDFCSSRGIDQLTWIDADIPIFDRDFLQRVCLPQGYSTWALTSGSSFLNTMTCSDIGRFVDFMLDFYARENRHALVHAIQAHGSDDMASAAHVIEQVQRAEPAFAELGIDPKHFSDMFLFSKFLQDTNAMAAKGEREKEEKEKELGEIALSADENAAPPLPLPLPSSSSSSHLPSPPRKPGPPKRMYIHEEENGGAIDPYFLHILNIRNEVPQPDSKDLCVDETVWNRYYSLRHDDVGSEKKGGSSAMAVHSRLGLSFNQSGAWVPIAGAHFQGDCKAMLLTTFLEMISGGSVRD